MIDRSGSTDLPSCIEFSFDGQRASEPEMQRLFQTVFADAWRQIPEHEGVVLVRGIRACKNPNAKIFLHDEYAGFVEGQSGNASAQTRLRLGESVEMHFRSAVIASVSRKLAQFLILHEMAHVAVALQENYRYKSQAENEVEVDIHLNRIWKLPLLEIAAANHELRRIEEAKR